jgi:hypothetical protein
MYTYVCTCCLLWNVKKSTVACECSSVSWKWIYIFIYLFIPGLLKNSCMQRYTFLLYVSKQTSTSYLRTSSHQIPITVWWKNVMDLQTPFHRNGTNIFYITYVRIHHRMLRRRVSFRDIFRKNKASWKVKVKFALEQAMKAQKRSRGIALLFF